MAGLLFCASASLQCNQVHGELLVVPICERDVTKFDRYPKVDRELREHYEILGRKVSLCTINLRAPWQSIDQEIRELMN
jgi:hypothetical protein